MKKKCLLLALLVVTSTHCFGWWDTGHMLIVEMAKNELDPSVIKQIDEIVDYFKEDFPESSTFVTAACFADDITSLELSGLKVWHGQLTPYDPEGILSSSELELISSYIATYNVEVAIYQSLKVLRNPQANKWIKSFMLRVLLHCVGDIHQPLHCAELYSNQFPHGDKGGHRFQLKGSKFNNLHVLWDGMFGLGYQKFPRPLDTKNAAWLSELAKEIKQLFPPESLPEKDNKNIAAWSKESYNLAVEVAYAEIQPNEIPSEAYLAEGQKWAIRQIALAGYRLANLLQKLF